MESARPDDGLEPAPASGPDMLLLRDDVYKLRNLG